MRSPMKDLPLSSAIASSASLGSRYSTNAKPLSRRTTSTRYARLKSAHKTQYTLTFHNTPNACKVILNVGLLGVPADTSHIYQNIQVSPPNAPQAARGHQQSLEDILSIFLQPTLIRAFAVALLLRRPLALCLPFLRVSSCHSA